MAAAPGRKPGSAVSSEFRVFWFNPKPGFSIPKQSLVVARRHAYRGCVNKIEITSSDAPKPARASDPTPSNTEALPRLAYTMRETAEILGVSYITVYRLLKRGKLRASDAVRNKVIPRTEIERFLRESISDKAA